MSTPEIVVHAQANILASAAAARLITRLVDIQAAGSVPKLVLTGGGVGIAMLEQVRATVARDAVDWGEVEFYWGDERFLPPGDPERNDTQARSALLDHIRVDPSKVGTGPWSSGEALLASSAAYSSAAASAPGGPVPWSAPIGYTFAGSTRMWSSSAARACVSLRSGSPGGRNRSSPQ